MSKKNGFTLIELIIVIVILGILAAIAMPAMSAYAENARKAAAQTNIRQIEKAIYVAASGVKFAGSIDIRIPQDPGMPSNSEAIAFEKKLDTLVSKSIKKKYVLSILGRNNTSVSMVMRYYLHDNTTYPYYQYSSSTEELEFVTEPTEQDKKHR